MKRFRWWIAAALFWFAFGWMANNMAQQWADDDGQPIAAEDLVR